jgi:hypothetical protein
MRPNMLQYANEKSREKDSWKENNKEKEKVTASSLNQFFSQIPFLHENLNVGERSEPSYWWWCPSW